MSGIRTCPELRHKRKNNQAVLELMPALTIQITKEENEKLRKELQSQKEKENELKMVKDQVNSMQSMLEKLIVGLSDTADQQHLNTVAKSLFSSGLLKTITMPTSPIS